MDKQIGTSRDIQAMERKKEILKVARNLFAKKGYHATSIRSINQTMGVADGLTYHYFPKGKLQILHTIIHEEIAEKENSLLTMIKSFDDNPPIWVLLFSVSHIVYEVIMESRELILIVLREKDFLEENDKEFNLSSEKAPEYIKVISQEMVKYLRKCTEFVQINELDYEQAISQFFSSLLIDSLRKVLPEDHNPNVDHHYINRFVDFTLSMWS